MTLILYPITETPAAHKIPKADGTGKIAAGWIPTLTGLTSDSLTLNGAPGKIKPAADSTTALQIAQTDGTAFITFDTSNSRQGIGTVAPAYQLHIVDQAGSASRGIGLEENFNNAVSPNIFFKKSRGSFASKATINNGDYIAALLAEPYDGTNYLFTAGIAFRSNGTVGTGSIPTDILFATGAADDPSFANVRLTISGSVITAAIPVTVNLPTVSATAYLKISSATASAFSTRLGTTASNQYAWFTNLYYDGSAFQKDSSTNGGWRMNHLVAGASDAANLMAFDYSPRGGVTTSTILSWTGTGIFTFVDAATLVMGSTTGTKIGTATSQKLGFWNATPIVQPANTVAIDDVLVNTGLRASGGSANFTLNITGAAGMDNTIIGATTPAIATFGSTSTTVAPLIAQNTAVGALASSVLLATFKRGVAGQNAQVGYAGRILVQLRSSSLNSRDAAYIDTIWNVPTETGAISDLVLSAVYNPSNTPAAREGLRIRGGVSATQVGAFGVAPVAQPATAGTTTGFTAGGGTTVTDASTFTGGTGSTAYRISDIVLALKQLGWMAA